MKLSFKSKLMAPTTPGFSVRTDRALAQAASVLIIPPLTKPERVGLSSVGVMSRVAVPSPVSTSARPSHSQAREVARVRSLTALSLWYFEAGRRGPRHQPVLVVQHVRLPEHQGLLPLPDAADPPKPPLHHRAHEIVLP